MSPDTKKQTQEFDSDEQIAMTTVTIERSRNDINRYISEETRRTIISFAFIAAVHLVECYTIVIVNDKLPDRKKYPPLPDIVLDNVAYIPWGGNMADTCILILALMGCGLLFFHKRRLVIMRRMCALTGTMYFVRCICIVLTSVPVSDIYEKCNVYPNAGIWNRTSRAFEQWSSLGMRLLGARACGDYIFSGHTLILTMVNLFINEYTPGMHLLHISSWTLNLVGMAFILVCRSHYTIDVFLAFYITIHLFSYYHTLVNNQAIMMRERKKIWVCFPMFLFLEEDSNNTFMNEYEWPIPKVTTFFKSLLRKHRSIRLF